MARHFDPGDLSRLPEHVKLAIARAKVIGKKLNCRDCRHFADDGGPHGSFCRLHKDRHRAPGWRNADTHPPSIGEYWAWCHDLDEKRPDG